MTHPAIISKFEVCEGCTPTRDATPHGYEWTHQRDCTISPNEQVRDTHPELFKRPPTSRLTPLQPHAACRASFADGGTTCSRCAPLLNPSSYDEAHADDASDWGQA